MLIMNAVIHFSTPPLLRRGHKKKTPSNPRTSEHNLPNHCLVYISPCTYEPGLARGLVGLCSFSTCQKHSFGTTVAHMWNTLSPRQTLKEDVPCLPKDVPVHPENIKTLVAFVLFGPTSSWRETDFYETYRIKVSFWIRSPPKKAHTQALYWGRRLRVQGCQHAPKTIWSALRSSPA